MTTYTYNDGYLTKLITEDRETRAMAEVGQIGTLPQTWVSRLTILRAYIITCIECQASADDLFAQKLAAYRKEYDTALPQARTAQAVIEAQTNTLIGGASIFTCDLQRG